MATFRDLLHVLQNLSETQLNQEIKIIPTGYCSEVPVNIDGYSPFSGEVELAISKGDVIYEEGADSLQCGSGFCGCSDTEEWDVPASELEAGLEPGEQLYSKEAVVLGPGLPYIRIANMQD
jgi:hypothetical protein